VSNTLISPKGTKLIHVATKTTTPKSDAAPKPIHVKIGGVTGKTSDVNQDIVGYVRAVGEYYGVNIEVTSGYRDPTEQANAMYSNWLALDRGKVYSQENLPTATRKEMDAAYKVAKETPEATATEKTDAEKKFLELGKAVPGYHTRHRALDIRRTSLPEKAKQALDIALKQVDEPKNPSIWHYQKEEGTILPVTEATKEKWPKP
jgi:hypothetical protein